MCVCDDVCADFLTVGETSPEPPTEEMDEKSINSVENLSQEATMVNHSFSQMVLQQDGPLVDGERNNPFVSSGETSASVAYRYREVQILPGVKMVVRCEVGAVAKGPGGRPAYASVKALNEYDDSQWDATPWRTHLDRQRGAVLATELKNNGNKLSRWACEALLGDVNQVRVGFVSRNNFKSNSSHSVLGIQAFQPKEFATQINMDVRRAWGLLQYFVEECLALPEGKYMMLKDPNDQVLRIFGVPSEQ
jgi:translation initiation factor 3 subunit D